MTGLSRRSLIRSGVVLGTGVGVVALSDPFGLWRADIARAAANVVPCGDWGARASSQPVTVLSRNPNKILVHHTASANSSDTSRAHAYALARSIQNDHMNRRGFIDTGQHFTISRGGIVMEGRHRSLEVLRAGHGHVSGAHCVGQNDQAIGIENEGTYLTGQPPAALWDSLVAFCAFACQQYAIPPTELYGHKDFNATECPGLLHDRLLHRLEEMRLSPPEQEVLQLSQAYAAEKDLGLRFTLHQAIKLAQRKVEQQARLAEVRRQIELKLSLIEQSVVHLRSQQQLGASANLPRDIQGIMAHASAAEALEAELGEA